MIYILNEKLNYSIDFLDSPSDDDYQYIQSISKNGNEIDFNLSKAIKSPIKSFEREEKKLSKISLQEDQKKKLIRLINDESEYKVKKESFIDGNGEEYIKIRYLKQKGKRLKMNPKLYLKKQKCDNFIEIDDD